MAGALSEADLGRIEAAVREAERGTTAEIVVVIGRGAETDATLGPALAALAVPLPLVLLAPRLSALTVYTLQLAVLGVGLALMLVPAVRRRLTPAGLRQRRVRRAAQAQFFERSLNRTAGRTGVLLFISPEDHAVEIIADAGAEGALPDEVWRPGVEALLGPAREGRLADGIVAALARLGERLRAGLPAGAGQEPNELPDRPVTL